MQARTATSMPMPSFDARQASFTASHAENSMIHSSHQSMTPNYRKYDNMNGSAITSQVANISGEPPQIYSAVYSSIPVYEMEVNDIAIMRRRADSWLNATQILKVAGVDKGKRTKVLEKEILTGEHEKVQGGYGKYQGTWINYRRGREFCRQYGVEELLRPLLEYDMGADGPGAGAGLDTPTKEQAMAANRKRMYTQSQETSTQGNRNGNGTFFSNLSSAASNAISAMNKAARLNTPPHRTNSNPRRTGSAVQKSMPNSQESFQNSPSQQLSQQSMPRVSRERSFNADSAYVTQPADQMYDSQEPPRKRMRATSPHNQSRMNGESHSFIRDGSPTEAGDSFIYRQPSHLQAIEGETPTALSPLPHPTDRASEEKQSLLLDLFADLTRTDYTNHNAIKMLQGEDLDLPLDQSANTALHWAATLARIPLMRLLIDNGASIYRGNIAGETALMAAVQVNNCLDHTCFPELLELLHPLIEIRDAKERTILHHIALASGITGRAVSSKYYLEALLEYLVRSTSSNDNSSQPFDGTTASQTKTSIGLMRFMSEIVNARDMAGNSALNLAARIGNRSIIRQLIEVQADPTIPNHKGLRPVDFGVEHNDVENVASQQVIPAEEPSMKISSKIEEVSRELVPTLSMSMAQLSSQFATELQAVQDRVDKSTTEIRDLSSQQTQLSQQLEAQKHALRSSSERKLKIQNFRRAVNEIRERSGLKNKKIPVLAIGEADKEYTISNDASLPEAHILSAQASTYDSLIASLHTHLVSLRARDTELEAKYRKVVALCTNVPEDRVDDVLQQLVQAVESEPENDVSRVREFLKRVEAVTST